MDVNKMELVEYDLEQIRARLDKEREDLVEKNAQIDREIARGEDVRDRLQARADNMEEENEKRRKHNAEMREKIRLMKEQLEGMK